MNQNTSGRWEGAEGLARGWFPALVGCRCRRFWGPSKDSRDTAVAGKATRSLLSIPALTGFIFPKNLLLADWKSFL